jgi:uncharacterized protein (TIGR02145 family)
MQLKLVLSVLLIIFVSFQLKSQHLNRKLSYGIVSDIDGNTYKTIQIGTQVWMAENLRTTKYGDGSNIPVVADESQWEDNWNNEKPLSQPMMCWYNNDQATYTANKFGALYNWYAINPATNGNKNVCPTGWHVPTDADWTTLTTYLGGEYDAGGKLKSTGDTYWYAPNKGATNTSGFSGLPGGYRTGRPSLMISFRNNKTFDEESFKGGWWSSMEVSTDTNLAWYRYLGYNYVGAGRDKAVKVNGYSVRCLRD